MSWWSELLGTGVVKPIVDAVSRRGERKHEERMRDKEIDAAVHKARLEAAARGETLDASWEEQQVRHAGIKDDVTLYFVLLLVVLCFIPSTAPHALEGFEILKSTPEWFQWMVPVLLLAQHGIRLWRRKA